jgi:hypothetical protein
MKILTSCQLYGYRPKKDKSLSLTFITGEKTPAQVMEIHGLLDSFGYLVFKAEEQLTKEEIESLDSLDSDLYDNPKTQSQRLRNVLYKLHEQDNQGIPEFKDFYKHETERIITHYKNKLDN